MSFETRGASIPFRTRNLRCCRLRVVDTGRAIEWEACLPAGLGDTGSRGTMVLPWTDLPLFSRMSDRDRALYDQIDALDDDQHPDPFAIRDAVIRVDGRDDADPAVRDEAVREIERDRRDRLRVYMSFLAQLTRDCGIHQGDRFMAGADTDMLIALTNAPRSVAAPGIDPKALTDRVLGFAADRLGITPKAVNARLEEFTRHLAPFGCINVEGERKVDGFLTRTRNRIAAMDRSIAREARRMRSETEGMSAMIRFAIKDFLDYSGDRLDRIEQVFSHLYSMFRDYERTRALAMRIRRDVSYALDGWSQLCDVWEGAVASREPQRIEEAVRYILTVLPLMPEEEVRPGGERGRVWRGFEAARVQMVRVLVGWDDDEVDEELLYRLADARRREEESREAAGPRRRRRA